MKKILILSGIVLSIFLMITLNCQQPASSGGGGDGSNKNKYSILKVIKITVGYLHSAVILDNGTVKCWGYNLHGQLGYGDTNNKGDNSGEMGDNLPSVDL